MVQPKSGINFVLYNNLFEVIDENTGYLPVDDNINAIQNLATDQIVMKEAGFIEIFVNNDAKTPVYYDNMMVTMRGGINDVLEVNAYYPFGMLIPGLSLMAPPDKYNAYKHSAKELQKEMELQWYDHGARMFSPVLGGRWMTPDPLCEKYYWISPYAYCFNNPIKFIDPDGTEPWKVTRQWERSDVSRFYEYSKQKIQEFKNSKLKDNCANFALRMIVGYASENGLPLSLKNRSGKEFDSTSDDYSTTSQYLNAVLSGIFALDLPLNSYEIEQSETQSGDFEVMQYTINDYQEVDFQHVVIFENVNNENVNKSDVVWGNMPPAELKSSNFNWPRSRIKDTNKTNWYIMTGNKNSRWDALNPEKMRREPMKELKPIGVPFLNPRLKDKFTNYIL